VALVHFDLPSIFRSAVEFGRVVRDSLPGMMAVGTSHEYAADGPDYPDSDALETARRRLAQSLIPDGFDSQDTDRLVRYLVGLPDISDNPTEWNGEEREQMSCGVRLLQDCESAQQGAGAGKALGALALAMMDKKYYDDPLHWVPEFEKAVKGLWNALPQSDRQQLNQVYRDACEVWTWCVECGATLPAESGENTCCDCARGRGRLLELLNASVPLDLSGAAILRNQSEEIRRIFRAGRRLFGAAFDGSYMQLLQNWLIEQRGMRGGEIWPIPLEQIATELEADADKARGTPASAQALQASATAGTASHPRPGNQCRRKQANVSLEVAFPPLLSLLDDAPRPEQWRAEGEQYCGRLGGPMEQVGRAIESTDLRHLLLDSTNGWDAVNATGQYARELLQLTHEPTAEAVFRHLSEFVDRGHSFRLLALHVRRFMADALAERSRLYGGELPCAAVTLGTANEEPTGEKQGEENDLGNRGNEQQSVHSKRQTTKPKRSTQRGDAEDKFISALSEHHQYAHDSCLNLEPIGNNALARKAGATKGAASYFFNKHFSKGKSGGHRAYQTMCRDASKLTTALKMLRKEYAPHLLLGTTNDDAVDPAGPKLPSRPRDDNNRDDKKRELDD
jgi:hypothetical protein